MQNSNIKKVLVVGAILLLAGTNFVSALNRNFSTDSMPLERRNIFYVGGSGPGNYTTIQDAVNASSDGDVVFVYSGSYYENIRINKSIDLIGENKETTIIDSNSELIYNFAINILSNFVTISGFTIRNRETNSQYPEFCGGIVLVGARGRIFNNYIVNNTYGIYISGDYRDYSIIRKNIISKCRVGIFSDCSGNNIISWNTFTDNTEYGVFLGSSCTEVCSVGNLIFCNNFIKNKCDLSFEYYDLVKFLFLIMLHPLQLNKFCWNYYDDHPFPFPRIIQGGMSVFFDGHEHVDETYTWFNVDWFPAQKPYDIGG
jgi:parallel beta-helix repeat protein